MKGISLHRILLSLLLFLTAGCSTQKNTAISRFYHNLTSHYNVYFNGKESVKEGLRRMDKSVIEDYTQLLPIFPETNPKAVQAAASEMEYAVQKCLKLISTHSISTSPRRKPNKSEAYLAFASKGEYNKWIDDTYLLMGQASYYLRDFHKAQESFNYILHNFSDQPTRNPAFLWLSRCYLETGESEKTQDIFKLLERDGSLPASIKKDLLLVKAYYYLLKGDTKEAVSLLNQTLKFKLSKREQSRYNFILAQLYQRQQQNDQAIAAYKRVLKARPPYRMKFEAKITLLELSNESPEQTDQELAKMIRAANSLPFLDRIYYARAMIALKSGRMADAFKALQTSVAKSVENNSQRALSSLTVARLFFEKGNYRMASCYYDSALAVVDQYYPGYEELVTKANGLSSLVKNLDQISREDSLQRVALMSEKDRLSYINKIIEVFTAAENAKLKQQQNEQNNQSYFRNQQYRNMSDNSQGGSMWYFYNPVTAGLGKTEFQQIWGKRILEDNWRRKNKIAVSADNDQNNVTADTQKKEALKPKISDPKMVEYYLQDLPLKDSLMQISNERIKSALFGAGRIYISTLKDTPHAVELFDQLNKRFPGSIYELSTWIELHKINYQPEIYRARITQKYPGSNYAKFLSNPDFFREMESRKQQIEKKYSEATTLYRKGDYSAAGKIAQEVTALQPDSFLLPRVKFIELVATGKNSSQNDFGRLLDKYISDFPGSPAKPIALKIRDLIRQNSLVELEKAIARIDSAGLAGIQVKKSGTENDPFGGKYSYDEDLFHYFLLSFPKNAKVDVNRLIFDIANFNIDYYTSFDFEIEEISLNDQINLVVVRSLPNKEEGLGYFGNILKQKEAFKTLKGVDYHYFIASSPNYRKLISDQDLLEYLRFFVQNYSKNSSPSR